MSLDTEFKKELAKYLEKAQSPVARSHNTLVRELLESPHCESWKILSEVFKYIESRDPNQLKDLLYSLDRLTRDIKSFPMLVYLYSLKLTRKEYHLYIYWKLRYQEIAINNGDIILFSTWVTSDPASQIVQDSLWLMANTVPTMMSKENIEMTEVELNAIIQWVTFLETPDPGKYAGACQLVKTAKQTHLKVRDDYIQKQHMILKKLVEIAGQSSNASPNIFLFIYPFTLREKDINYFCHVYSDFLLDLAEENICNFFIAITKSAISKEIICLISKISQMLRNEDEYFKLRIIYEKFILPILIRRAKACNKVEDAVYEISSFFVLGFLKHCDIGEVGLECVLKNIGKIKDEKIKRKWVELCSIICVRYLEAKPVIVDSLKKQLDGAIELNPTAFKEVLDDPEIVWEVTLRSGRKHKKYPKVPSNLKGIENSSNECYIISTVQGLHKTRLLEELLTRFKDEIKGKFQLLDEMRILFQQISGKRKADHIKVSYLKRKGPELFSQSQHQEDAHQYIIQLFDSIEKELKKIPSLFVAFKKLFELKIKSTIQCANCKQQAQNYENSYTYTIPHTQILSNVTQDFLPGYMCDKCGQRKDTTIQRRLQAECSVLIVHINRFSHEKGKTKKELSTQTILRTFLKYELVGMICHIGKNVEHGHYIFYSRVSPTRWAQFNDKYVEEFDLGKEDEEFQREMKAEMTPYILFYQRQP